MADHWSILSIVAASIARTPRSVSWTSSACALSTADAFGVRFAFSDMSRERHAERFTRRALHWRRGGSSCSSAITCCSRAGRYAGGGRLEPAKRFVESLPRTENPDSGGHGQRGPAAEPSREESGRAAQCTATLRGIPPQRACGGHALPRAGGAPRRAGGGGTAGFSAFTEAVCCSGAMAYSTPKRLRRNCGRGYG